MRMLLPLRGLAGFALVLAFAIVSRGEEPAATAPNLLLIVSDTLRADALGCYGGPAHAPHICGLAEGGVLFERAYSSAARTLPASVALLTGNHAPGYARVARGDPRDGGLAAYFYVLDEEELLAERLRSRGYEVVADVENPVAEQSNNLQGFRRLPAPAGHVRFSAAARLGVDTSDPRYWRALVPACYLLDREGGPFFLLHWIEDPHAAYAPPPRLQHEIDLDRTRLPHPLSFYADLDSRGLRRRDASLSGDEIEALRRLYWKEVESVDERVGATLKALRMAGLGERTYVVFTSDHGEGFGEHGRFQHGTSFYDEQLRVPLIVAGPGLPRGRRVDRLVGHVDLVPTLVELLGLEAGRSQGRSFASLLRSGEDPTSRVIYVADSFRWRKNDAVIRGRYKLISTGGKLELYDLYADPAETKNLAGEEPEKVEALQSQLEQIRGENEARRVRNLEFHDARTLERTREETKRQLRALGYID